MCECELITIIFTIRRCQTKGAEHENYKMDFWLIL